jgi:hypothetical protein
MVQGHDASRPDQQPPHGELRQQARPHPPAGGRDRFRQLLVHGRQQPRSAEGLHGRVWPPAPRKDHLQSAQLLQGPVQPHVDRRQLSADQRVQDSVQGVFGECRQQIVVIFSLAPSVALASVADAGGHLLVWLNTLSVSALPNCDLKILLVELETFSRIDRCQ